MSHHAGLQAQALRIHHQSLGAGSAARMHPHLSRAQACCKSLQVSPPLYPGTHHQQSTLRLRGQPLRCQQGDRRRAAGGDGGAIQHRQALAGRHVEHQHIPLNGGQTSCRITGREGDELGHGHPTVVRRHDEQAAPARQRLHQAGRHVNRGVHQHLFHRLGQRGVREPFGCGFGIANCVGEGLHRHVHATIVGAPITLA